MEELLTMREASKVLKISVADTQTLRRKKLIKCMRLGSWKVRRAELDRFIRESEGKVIDIKGSDDESV